MRYEWTIVLAVAVFLACGRVVGLAAPQQIQRQLYSPAPMPAPAPPPTTVPAQQAQPQPQATPTSQQPAQGTDAAQNAQVPITLHLDNADLLQVVAIIAAELRINYVVDPQVKGTVNINTLGDLRRADLFPLLQLILRINGATAVQTGNFYRIVPLQNLQRMPIEPLSSGAQLPSDDRVVMNIIPLKYVAAADMTRILTPFLSEGGHLFSHEAGNILIVTDSSRSMNRLMELVAQFDSEVFTNQRARLYPIRNSEATKMAEELKNVFAAYGLSGGTSAVRFVPIERINSVLVVSANPSVYSEVEKWLERLDQPVQQTGIRTFVYKVENGKAENLARVLSQLLLGMTFQLSAATTISSAQGMPANVAQQGAPLGQQAAPPAGAINVATLAPMSDTASSHIRIVPDNVNNMLLIQATTQEFEEIRRTLHDLDVVPRQVMLEAKVYEVDLTGALSFGVSAFLQNRGGAVKVPGDERKLQGSFTTAEGATAAALNLSIGTLVGRTRELLLFLNASETHGQARVISAPSILASDNTPANINVGTEVPILTSQALAGGAQSEGNTLFTNTIQNRDTGVLLTITPRINSSGLVNMQIQQEVSVPLPVPSSGIQSPSIQKRTINTQVVVQDGQTIALGGIIQENRSENKNRIPILGDIPYVGGIFGNTSRSSQRTELIVLLTPTVIRDSSEAQRASTEFRNKLRDLEKIIEEDEQKEKERQQQQSSDSPKPPEPGQS